MRTKLSEKIDWELGSVRVRESEIECELDIVRVWKFECLKEGEIDLVKSYWEGQLDIHS